MKELIAFIVMALCIGALIEFNERRKKKKSNSPEDKCPDTACTDCSLLDICGKDKKN